MTRLPVKIVRCWDGGGMEGKPTAEDRQADRLRDTREKSSGRRIWK